MDAQLALVMANMAKVSIDIFLQLIVLRDFVPDWAQFLPEDTILVSVKIFQAALQ